MKARACQTSVFEGTEGGCKVASAIATGSPSPFHADGGILGIEKRVRKSGAARE